MVDVGDKRWTIINRRSWLVGFTVLALLLGVGLLAVVGGDEPASSETPLSAEGWAAKYGGRVSIYQSILLETNCNELKRQLDVAAEDILLTEPVSEQHRAAVGYMAAAYQQAQQRGCFGWSVPSRLG